MDAVVRRDAIQELVDRDGYVRLADLTRGLGVAPVTVHRDLEAMAAAGTVERVRGGARSVNGHRHEIRTDFVLRRAQSPGAKSAIAERARDEVRDGDTIFLDSSTTTLAFALELEKADLQGITVVTNSPAIAFQLHAAWMHVIVTPGALDQSLRAITGTWTVDFLRGLNLTAAFVSAGGVTPDGGLMTTQRDVCDVIGMAFERSDRHIALIDSTKFGISALLSAASFGSLDLLVTDEGLSDDMLAQYRAAGAPVIVAGTNEPDAPANPYEAET